MDDPPRDELRLVLIGKTGNGKSKTGNTIIGKSVFDFGSSADSVTQTCQVRDTTRLGRHVIVVDTPGLFDPNVESEAVHREIKRCIGMTCPGPHAVILCVPIGRFTGEDIETVKSFSSHFGEELVKYTIVLFTGYDNWKRDREDKSQDPSIQGFIDSLSEYPKSFLTKCKNRYVAFDNTLKWPQAENQVKELIQLVDKIIEENGNSCYTNEDYRKAEIELQKVIEIEKQNRQREIDEMEQKIRDETDEKLRKEYEAKMNELIGKNSTLTIRNDLQKNEWWLSLITKTLKCLCYVGTTIASTVINANKS